MSEVRDQMFDAVIVGGGIYGIMLALEGAARGRRVLLLERDDYGGLTSSNSLRTIHGGLRYLQTLDLCRARSSSRERAWWIKNFPDLVHAIPCLMPLYGGLRSPPVFRMVFPVARVMGITQVPGLQQAPAHVVSGREVREIFPQARIQGLRGGAVWHDAFMPSSERVLIESLRWAVSAGVTAVNGLELLRAGSRGGVWSLTAADQTSGEHVQLSTRVVINAAGPSVSDVARRLTGNGLPQFTPTLAWNLLLDRAPLSRSSVAVSPPHRSGRTYFIHPFHDRMLVGTGHAVPERSSTTVGDHRLSEMLDDLNAAVAGGNFTRRDIAHVLSGILPGARHGSDRLLKKPRLISGPGVVHVIGVKFTEAPVVARTVWDRIAGARTQELPPRPLGRSIPPPARLRQPVVLERFVDTCVRDESARSADDAIWRRSAGWVEPYLRRLAMTPTCGHDAADRP